MRNIVILDFLIIILINILDFSQSEKLECFACSDESNDPQAKCSQNPTRTRKATDDSDYRV